MNIKRIIREELDMIDEGITSGQSIVWHRTKEENLKGIQENGYIIGENNAVGKGIYACFDFKSQLTPENRGYGNVIVECKVKSLDGFLSLFPQESKNMYGNKWKFKDQMITVFSRDLYNQLNVDKYISQKLFNDIDNGLYTDPESMGGAFYRGYLKEYYKYFNGLIYNSASDGRCLVSYDKDNMTPVRYTLDDGKTWVAFTDSKVYNRNYVSQPNELDVNDKINKKINPQSKFSGNVGKSNVFQKNEFLKNKFIPILNLLKTNPDLITKKIDISEYGDLSLSTIYSIIDLIKKNPDLLDKFDITKFDVSVIFDVVTSIPQFIDKFDISGFDSRKITFLIIKNPEFVDKLDLSKLDSFGVKDILSKYPEFVDKLDLSKIHNNNNSIMHLVQKHPELIDKFDMSKIDVNTLETYMLLHVLDCKKSRYNLDFSKLDKRRWEELKLSKNRKIGIVQDHPELAKHFEGELNEQLKRIIREELKLK